MSTLWQDLRYGARTLAKKPVFTLVAVLTLSLGIGVNTTIFSLINALLLRPLGGVQEPERVAQIGGSNDGKGFNVFSYPDYRDVRDQNTVFADVAVRQKSTLDVSNGETTERISGEGVSGNYFDLLGVRVLQGRLLTASDDTAPGANPVVVISASLWQRQFGSDPMILGKTIHLNSQPFTVVGIVPEEFSGVAIGEKIDAWVPITMVVQLTPFLANLKIDWFNKRDSTWITPLARLKPGVSAEQAQAELLAISEGLAEAYPKTNDKLRFVLDTNPGLFPASRETARQYTLLLLGLVGIILLIACANIANLQLARAATRQKEIAVRLALGASRIQIVKQLLIESLLLAMLGGIAGVVSSLWLNELFLAMLPQTTFMTIPTRVDLSLDFRVLAFTLVTTLLTGLLFGLFPALQASRPDLIAVLKDSHAAGNKSEKSRLRNSLVVLQVALSLMLMVAAGLVIKTFRNAQAIHPGFEPDNQIIANIDLGRHGYDQQKGVLFCQQLLERVQSLPGVQSASIASHLPLGGNSYGSDIRIAGRANGPNVRINNVTPDYLETMRIPLLAGRHFTAQDNEGAQGVIIINETLAQNLWGDENPLGKQFEVLEPNQEGKLIEVIGVARDIKVSSLFEKPINYVYLPLVQNYRGQLTLYVRANANPENLIAAVRREVMGLDPQLPIFNVTTLPAHLREVLSPQRVNAALITAFGVLALLLAGVGIYGVMSYTVTQRTQEIGIRMALGADHRDAILLILKQGARLVVVGVVLGLAGAYAATRLLSSILFNVSATDTATFILVPMILIGVALTACFVPARRAAKTDPLIALRYE